ncbi:MAG: membrane protein insertase YidC [Betaproteobacteria bacterium]|jgi:YidC/Oxa1 family membrane protein insertase
MNDIKRTILWVIFGFSMVLLWDQWQVYNGKKPMFFPQKELTTATEKSDSDIKVNRTSEIPKSINEVGSNKIDQLNKKEGASSPKQNTYVLKNQNLELTISSEGGSIIKSRFLKQTDPKNNNEPISLLDESKQRIYLAQSGLIGNEGNIAFPNHKTALIMTKYQHSEDKNEKQNLEFSTEGENGIKLIKTFTLSPDQYYVDIKHTVINETKETVSPKLYVQIIRDGNKPDGESDFYSTFTGPAVFTQEKKYEKIEFKDIENNKVSIQNKSNYGYVAMVQHYYVSAWMLSDEREREIYSKKIDTNLYSVGMISGTKTLEPGNKIETEARFYSGPQEEKNLEDLYPGLELVKDYGWLTILAKPLYWLLYKINANLDNWGWSIVALVVLLKIAFFWLNAQAYKSMAKMKAINPKIMEMRERLKDKPQQIQMEMMKIYKEEKVNPMGGCLPIMVQIPVFIALYWVLLSTVEMRNTPWIAWINDLSSPDPYFILPLLMTLTSLMQTWLNPTPPDPIQAKMMWIMPLAFSVMFFFFPAGLVLYWLTNNILSISQQWLINKKLGVNN